MAKYSEKIREEELKNKVGKDYFSNFDATSIIGNVDFCVSVPPDPLGLNEAESLFWAESKRGTNEDIFESIIQLILTLGKERPQDSILPPAFIGAFDAEKIAFLPYNAILEVLRQNDFNWNVTPSDHNSKEFLQLKNLLSDSLHRGLEIYDYEKDAKELAFFINNNFKLQTGKVRHIRINKNNFTHIYLKWLNTVKPTININWEQAKKAGIIDADFYLADILSKENNTLGEKLFVLLQNDHYLLDRKINDFGLENFTRAEFTDYQKAHNQFWNRYARPPRREYWDDIVNRRDLLVPQDVRERKGSYFTPAKWVELSQQYIAAELGENWQEEYYVWDCCAGTGNLLAGLTNKYNIYASTLDKADVQAIFQRIEAMNAAARDKQHGGANLLESHVFQFDFLNDILLDEMDDKGNVTKKSKLPQSLQDIIRNKDKRKKLIIYINPPYAEAGDSKQLSGTGKNKTDVAVKTKTYVKYLDKIGIAGRELFAQFLIRIWDEMPSVVLAQFSTLKIMQAPNFLDFRKVFRAKLGRSFIVPANTFDNVKGKFPIGFFIWHTDEEEEFSGMTSDVYNKDGEFLGKKNVFCYDDSLGNIGKWVNELRDDKNHMKLGFLSNGRNDFQNQKLVYFINKKSQMPTPRGWWITPKNLIRACIFVAVRHCIEATWQNDRDQFLYPNKKWEDDMEFQNNCLIFSLFSGFNNIQSQQGINYWIPFTEEEVDAKEKFESNFMSDYIKGKKITTTDPNDHSKYYQTNAFETESSTKQNVPIVLSPEAQNVMDAGKSLWKYYHQQPQAQPNASFYDIRMHFQGTKTKKNGKIIMNTESNDEVYTKLLYNLRQSHKELGKQIEPKIYEYGFLK